ncbi:MAG: SET domain-containing protein [Bacillota bacterium]
MKYKTDLVIDNIENTTIKKSSIHGLGLFATKTIPKGTLLTTLDGQEVTWDKFDEIKKFYYKHFKNNEFHFFLEWNAVSQTTLLVRPLRTKYSFINHSRNPNLSIDIRSYKITALKTINKDEELFLDYREQPLRKEYLNGHGATYL